MTKTRHVYFVEMMGEPGTYDASVYDEFEGKDREGVWFERRFGDVAGITLHACNVCLGEALPDPKIIEGAVLAGSYNSVHDNTVWQQRVREWLPMLLAQNIPVLGICGSHQLLAHARGASVEPVPDGPYAGTFEVNLTPAGEASPIMKSIGNNAPFQFANGEHVVGIPEGSTLLASSGPVSVAALDFGNHCYTTQFHPEGTAQTLSAGWRVTAPELVERYYSEESGYQLVRNFLGLVANQ